MEVSIEVAKSYRPFPVIDGYELEIMETIWPFDVFRGFDKKDESRIAFHLLNKDFSSADAKKCLAKEARRAMDLSHEHLVGVIHVGQYGQEPYFVTKSYATMGRYVTRQGLNLEEAVSPMIHCLEALNYVHSKGLVHGNINPSSIFFDDDRFEMMLGHNLITKVNADHQPKFNQCSWYYSPEQFMGKKLTQNTDLYHAAAAIFTLLTGTVGYPSRMFECPKYLHELSREFIEFMLYPILLNQKVRTNSAQFLSDIKDWMQKIHELTDHDTKTD